LDGIAESMRVTGSLPACPAGRFVESGDPECNIELSQVVGPGVMVEGITVNTGGNAFGLHPEWKAGEVASNGIG